MAMSKGKATANGHHPSGYGPHGGHHAFKHTAAGATGPEEDHMRNPFVEANRENHTAMSGHGGTLPG